MSSMISEGVTPVQPVELRIALVTAHAARGLDPDLAPLAVALTRRGFAVATPDWDDPAVDWSSFAAAVLRSTWDYVDRLPEFLDWCERCAARTNLLNPPGVVRWNVDKHYLDDLRRAGVPVVPTRFAEPGEDAPSVLRAFLEQRAAAGSGEFVVKPAIGAGSRDAARYGRDDVEPAASHLARLLRQGRAAMLQPYLADVDSSGETAVLYFGGRFSHAARKGPLLRAGAGLVEGLFAPEDIRPRAAAADELEVAAAAYRAIPFDPPAYARIDLLRDGAGRPVVLELELTEPSLFLDHADGAADAFAGSLARQLGVRDRS
jgi:O-ureido-D-serine cyclo-ligase